MKNSWKNKASEVEWFYFINSVLNILHVLRFESQTYIFRLSRPKSTPPVTRNTSSDLQGETLVVQRSRKGAHEIHRASAQK